MMQAALHNYSTTLKKFFRGWGGGRADVAGSAIGLSYVVSCVRMFMLGAHADIHFTAVAIALERSRWHDRARITEKLAH